MGSREAEVPAGQKRAENRISLPLWKVLQYEPAFLRYEIECLARDFGYYQMEQRAKSFGQAKVSLEIRMSQNFTEDDVY